jgi:hypothetical protein
MLPTNLNKIKAGNKYLLTNILSDTKLHFIQKKYALIANVAAGILI